jgi:arylsulfatase
MWGKNIQVAERIAPAIFSRPFTINAAIDIPKEGGQGVVFAAGSHFGGWSFFFDDGKPVVVASRTPFSGAEQKVIGTSPLRPGIHNVVLQVGYVGEQAIVKMTEDGALLGEGTIPLRPLRMAGQGETFDSGRDTNVPVSSVYRNGGVFNGEIHKLELRLD